MEWFLQLFTGHTTAHTVLTVSLVIALGILLGRVRVAGIGLGVAGVLFAGLILGHFKLSLAGEVLEFIREFGLVLFVYTIGMQVGPGFIASLRRQGLRLNLLAAAIVALGAGLAAAIFYVTGLPLGVVVGLLSGAVTNTPSLGAAQAALAEQMPGSPDLVLPGLAYAVAYPFGIMGVILTMVLARRGFRVDVEKEAAEFETSQGSGGPAPQNFNFEVTNARLVGVPVRKLAGLVSAEFVISRLLRREHVEVPAAETTLQLGDVLHVVCTPENAEKIAILVGDMSTVDVRQIASALTARNILLTQNAAVGRTLRELDLMRRYGVAITRIHRAGIELVASGNTELQFGDRLTAVGEESALKKVSVELGDSLKILNYPNILPIFIGILLGVILGSAPFRVPGVPEPVKLGLAGGPLLVAIILSRVGRIGPVVWYLPHSANLVLREIGIALFLACVGLHSGARVVETLVSRDGLLWMGLAALITLVPMFVVAVIARWVYRVNYLSLCGLLAGSMTDPPALSFANQLSGSDAPAVTYASVYPMVMFLRILFAQALVLLLA
jgi:putative transport protein